MKITGTIKVIFDKIEYDSGFTKREIVVTTNEQYPQDIKCEFVKDKCELLDKFGEGQQVEVSINLRGNEYNGKFYVNIQGWRIEEVKEAQSEPAPRTTTEPIENSEEDDLPF